MSRPIHGSHRDPNNYTLHEAKLSAWQLAIGESRSSLHYSGRRMHRGMLSDVMEPEPRRYASESFGRRLAILFTRWLQWFSPSSPSGHKSGAVAHFGPHRPAVPIDAKANDNDQANAA